MTRLSFRNETRTPLGCCAATDCDNPITPAPTGRPARYCSPACRARAHRHRHTTTPDVAVAVAEVTMGSASSRGRHPDRAWLVQLHRGNRNVVIAIGLRRPAADRLAQQINELLGQPAL